VSGTLEDRKFLELHLQRNAVHGLTLRDDLYALAQATPLTDKQTLNRICKDAIEAAAAGARANIGSAVHAFTEQVDRGEMPRIPMKWLPDVQAYVDCRESYGIEVDPDLIEVIAVCEKLDEPVAGTIDRIVRWQGGWAIADLKTGRSMDFGRGKIAQQLAIYSRADSLYDPESDSHLLMPDVDQDRGIVFHLPAGEGTCTPYLVDLNAGWEAAQHSVWTRAWRKREGETMTKLEAA
jgi:hypothetical protein